MKQKQLEISAEYDRQQLLLQKLDSENQKLKQEKYKQQLLIDFNLQKMYEKTALIQDAKDIH